MIPGAGGVASSSAVQLDITGEIAGLTAATVATGDLLMIEDVDASNAKKKVTAGAIAALATTGQWYDTRPTAWGAAHAYDDEFAAASLDAQWTWSTAPSGTIDRFAVNTSGAPYVAYATQKSSCLSWQGMDNAGPFISQAVTLDTNCVLWVRFEMQHQNLSPTSTDFSWLQMAVGTDTTFADYVSVISGRVDSGAGDYDFWGLRRISGANATIGSRTWATGSVPYNHMILEKIGTTYHAWGGTDSRLWHYFGSITHASTMANLMLRFYNDGNLPGTGVVDIDFIRYYNGTLVRLP
jgi:hypothetical protein